MLGESTGKTSGLCCRSSMRQTLSSRPTRNGATKNDATVSTSQLSFPQDRPNLSVLLPWPTASTLCHLPMVAPFAKDEIRWPLSL